METQNFYLILELPVDPPETDSNVIAETIKKKQAEWSRNRNHPTKGILAKQYIGLLPEIQKVMMDPELRAKEAAEARKILKERTEDKYTALDRHLSILLRKGSVTDQEVSKLSKIHQLDRKDILKRIKENQINFKIDADIEWLLRKGDIGDKQIRKLSKQYSIPEEKLREKIHQKREQIYREIDEYLEMCTRRGYITDKEIPRLAKLYSITDNEVLKRVKCPIRKESITKKAEKVKPLDKTIERLIEDNLKIVGKSSLYDFLELLPTSSLEILQTRAREKETEIRKISQKDAVATASGILVGHCIAIFKSEETRKAYDLCRAQSRLTALLPDIDLSQENGKIRSEYYNFLLRSAVKLGTDIFVADDYIQEYCKNQKWIIDVSPEKKRLRFLMAAIALSIVILLAGGLLSYNFYQSYQIKKAYNRVLQHVEETPNLEQKKKLLSDFINFYPKSSYVEDARKKIAELSNLIETRDYEALVEQVKTLEAANKHEEIASLYMQFLNSHPASPYASEINKKRAVLTEQIDERDFRQITSQYTDSHQKRIEILSSYLKKHPNGKYVSEIQRMITEVVEITYKELNQQLAGCEKKEDWQQCIGICTNYLNQFGENHRTAEVKGLLARYENKIKFDAEIAELKQKAKQKGNDYVAAKQVYLDYLNAKPEMSSYLRTIISKEIADLDALIQKQIQEKKEWEELVAFCNNPQIDIDKRFYRVESYVNRYPSSPNISEAKAIYEKLRLEKKARDEQLRLEQETREWQKLLASVKNTQLSITERIAIVEQFMKEYSTSAYLKDAKRIYAQLLDEKRQEDARLQAEQMARARIQREMDSIRAQLGATGGRFVDNGNGTITDKKTGLTWCMVDSYIELGRCIDFNTATEYVKRLRTGGYSDWRLPLANELAAIYKTKPFFPVSAAKWYWSSDIYWHGWNKRVYIVTTTQENIWNKDTMDLSQCGAVRAVR